MARKTYYLSLAFLAAISFAVLPGCDSSSTDSASTAGESDHDHEHAHEDGEHSHAHEHAEGDDHHEHEHGDGEHEGHDHDGHDHDGHGHGEHGDDHDHDFESLSEALTEIESLRDTIRDEFKAGNADKAHDPLHHIGAVLIATEDLVAKMDDSETKTSLAAAVESLLDDFTAVDEGMHGSEESKEDATSYEDVSKSIDEAIETLKKGAE